MPAHASRAPRLTLNGAKIVEIEADKLLAAAKLAADKLELEFEHVHVGYGELESGLKEVAKREAVG